MKKLRHSKFNCLAKAMQLRCLIFKIRRGNRIHIPRHSPLLPLQQTLSQSQLFLPFLPSSLCCLLECLYGNHRVARFRYLGWIFGVLCIQRVRAWLSSNCCPLFPFSPYWCLRTWSSHTTWYFFLYYYFFLTAVDKCRGYYGLWCSFACTISFDQLNSPGIWAVQGWPLQFIDEEPEAQRGCVKLFGRRVSFLVISKSYFSLFCSFFFLIGGWRVGIKPGAFLLSRFSESHLEHWWAFLNGFSLLDRWGNWGTKRWHDSPRLCSAVTGTGVLSQSSRAL